MVQEGKIYKYTYKDFHNVGDEITEYEKELEAISEKEPYCLVINEEISPEDDSNAATEGIYEVDFDIEQNLGKALPYSGKYSVFGVELTPVDETVEVKEDASEITEEQLDKTPSLLVAIDSEKDAELTYKTLIEEETDPEIVELLKHILSDELEHIALLSALAAKKNEEFVGKDSKQIFDNIVEETAAEE